MPQPLALTGALDGYASFKVTSSIGTEFKDLQLSSILHDHAKIRDLAILISQRNVAFFRNQDIGIEDQKLLAQKLGVLSGKPKESGLHVHPITPPKSELGDEVLVISNKTTQKPVEEYIGHDVSRIHSNNIHSDITYERYGTDYSLLKLVQVPEQGGDTLWYSGYEMYDRLSPPMRIFFERLSALHEASFLHEVALLGGFEVRTDIERGHPANVGGDLSAVHPVIRTNPVTGWKSIFISKLFVKRILGVTKDESDVLLDYIWRIQAQNHDLAVRFKWNMNDVAIWDNRSTFHSATFDAVGERKGERVTSIGERPYLDADSKSRREALALKPVW